MNATERWPILGELCRCAELFPDLELWVFGSVLTSQTPRDLDVLIVYSRRQDVQALRAMGYWEMAIPEVDIIAMTIDEVDHYEFIHVTGARPLRRTPTGCSDVLLGLGITSERLAIEPMGTGSS